MIDEDLLRRVVREELDRIVAPRLVEAQRPPAFLTIAEAALRYRRSYYFIRELVEDGKLEAAKRDNGRGGRPQYLVKTEDGDRHPELGGAL